MKLFRIALPLYTFFLKKYSRGKGYGKNKFVRKTMHFFDILFRNNEVEVHGHKMNIGNKEFLEYSTYGIYGELDTLAVEIFLKPGDYVIDVGAAIGYYTLIFARSVGNTGLVIAFEPKTDRYKLLLENIKLNKYENIKTVKKAILPKNINPTFLSRSDGRAGLRFLPENKTAKFYEQFDIKQKIPVVDLDEFLNNLKISEKISFIKIDVDGHELYVLKSSQNLLKNNNLKIFIEWDPDAQKLCDCNPEEIIDLLFENNFKIYFPDYKNAKYFEVNKNELMNIKTENQINMLCLKDSTLLKNYGLL